VGRRLGNGPVTDAARHDEEVTGLQLDGGCVVHFDAEAAVPAEEELVLLVLVPRKLAVEAGDADDGVVRDGKVGW
jgi:hypothetical protein